MRVNIWCLAKNEVWDTYIFFWWVNLYGTHCILFLSITFETLNGLIGEVRTSAKQSLLLWSRKPSHIMINWEHTSMLTYNGMRRDHTSTPRTSSMARGSVDLGSRRWTKPDCPTNARNRCRVLTKTKSLNISISPHGRLSRLLADNTLFPLQSDRSRHSAEWSQKLNVPQSPPPRWCHLTLNEAAATDATPGHPRQWQIASASRLEATWPWLPGEPRV